MALLEDADAVERVRANRAVSDKAAIHEQRRPNGGRRANGSVGFARRGATKSPGANRCEVMTVAPDSRFSNRELSWLDYNSRILSCGEDDRRPVLERARFLAIFSRNLDEFFQIRVSRLREQFGVHVAGTSPDGMSPRDQLAAIRERAQALVARQTQIFQRDVRPQLDTGGIRFVDWNDLRGSQRHELTTLFDERIFPVLTPLAVDRAHPFPYISDLSLNLAVIVRDPHTDLRRFASVQVPPLLPRFLRLARGPKVVAIEQVIAANLGRLFPAMVIVEHHPFRVTRDADVEVEVDDADDLFATLQSSLRDRERTPEAVRLEIASSMSQRLRTLLLRELRLTPADLYAIDGPLDLGDLWSLTELKRPARYRARPAPEGWW